MFRDSGYADFLWVYRVEIDGCVVDKIKNGEPAEFFVESGKHIIQSKNRLVLK